MTNRLTTPRSALLAGALGLLIVAGPAIAQAPPGFSPMDQTKPDKSGQAATLKPHPNPPTVTPVEKLPLDKIKLPAGFKAEVWSHGHPGGRTMVMGDKGTMFMGTRVIGRVYAITNKDGKREVKTTATGLTQPNGLAFKDGSLYVFAINKVLRYDNIEDNLDNPGTPVESDRQVQSAGHDPSQLEVRRVRTGRQDVRAGRLQLQHLRGQSRHPRADPPLQRRRHRHGDRGARHPQHGRLRLAPGDEGTLLHRQRPRLGRQCRTRGRIQPNSQGPGRRQFRLPVLPCHGRRRTPTSSGPIPCAGVVMPIALLGPHAGSLGIKFYTGKMFPAAYQNVALIARHGSWNREQKFGYDVAIARRSSRMAPPRSSRS